MIRLILILVLLAGCSDGSDDVTKDSPYLKITVEDEFNTYDMIYEVYDPSPMELSCTGSTHCALTFPFDHDELIDDDSGIFDGDRRLLMRLSYTAALAVDSFTLKDLQQEFRYLHFSLGFPDSVTQSETRDEYVTVGTSSFDSLQTLGETVVLQDTNGLRLDLTDYDGHLLSGTLEGVLLVATHHIEDGADPDCYMGDMVGVCVEEESINLSVEIDFRLPIHRSGSLYTDKEDI